MSKRPRRQPQRTCVACRRTGDKRSLIRIVRAPDGSVCVDPSGKVSGRGAYLCQDRACWQKALKGGHVARALNCELSADERESLARYAATLSAGVGDGDLATKEELDA